MDFFNLGNKHMTWNLKRMKEMNKTCTCIDQRNVLNDILKING